MSQNYYTSDELNKPTPELKAKLDQFKREDAEKAKIEKQQAEAESQKVRAMLLDIKARADKKIKSARPRLEKKFGVELSDDNILRILRAEKNNKECETCEGLPCKKKYPYFRDEVKLKIEERINQANVIVYDITRPCELYHKYLLQTRIKKNFGNSKIPKKYVGKNFDNIDLDKDNSAAAVMALWQIDHPTEGLYIYGGVGTGKTLIASIIAQEHTKRGRQILFCDVPSLLDDLRASIDAEDNSLTAMMETLQEVEILILDDLGAEYPTKWALERLYTIINNRYNDGKTVIVTSNLSLDDLAKKFGTVEGRRIASRLTEICKRIKVDGRDRRINQ